MPLRLLRTNRFSVNRGTFQPRAMFFFLVLLLRLTAASDAKEKIKDSVFWRPKEKEWILAVRPTEYKEFLPLGDPHAAQYSYFPESNLFRKHRWLKRFHADLFKAEMTMVLASALPQLQRSHGNEMEFTYKTLPPRREDIVGNGNFKI